MSEQEHPELTTDAWIDTLLNQQGLVDSHLSLDLTYFIETASRLLLTSTLGYAERRAIEASLCDIVAFDEQDELLARLRLNQLDYSAKGRYGTKDLARYIRYISDLDL